MTNEMNSSAAAAPSRRSRVPMGTPHRPLPIGGNRRGRGAQRPRRNGGSLREQLHGEVSLADRVGLHFTIPYVVSFYTLDRTTKQLDMLASSGAPSDGATLPVDDFLNVKAKDGDNVRIDVKVQYNIVPDKAVEVLRTSGSEVLELMKSPPAKSGMIRRAGSASSGSGSGPPCAPRSSTLSMSSRARR